MVHLGSVCGPNVVRDCLERGLTGRLFTVPTLTAALARFGKSGRSGAGVLRAVLEQRELGNSPADSILEIRMGTVFARYDLPKPVFHFIVRDGPRFVAEVDFAYPDLKIAIEVDGWAVHGTPDATRADFIRQNALELLGWTVLRFTWAQVTSAPDDVAATIRQLLRAKSVK
jgi:hypothetical protein